MTAVEVPANAPSGVVTFLFTDIEGSTRRWEADPDAMRTALAGHDHILREAVAAHGGWLFKHTGDGVCAAFSSPTAAVDAAVTAQRVLELPVRMGVATGEAELRSDDYFGAVLNRTARVMAAGHGGQILIEGTTASLLNGIDLMPLGPKRLRDLVSAIELFQVRAPGLATDFPPLKTLDVTRGNLRPAPTSFIGREGELTEVIAAVSEHRLVTLTGVGGVGKTRLAVQAAAGVAEKFMDGVWLVELAALGDPSAVPEAVAATLGITQQPGNSVTESIAEALEGRSRLLIFDNCEHVLDAAAELIEAILAGSRSLRILATSREGLRVADEQLWPVPPLDVRDGIESAAAALFVQRAVAVAPGTPLAGADEEAAIVEICNRLDGIPLAIELAASRMLSMTAVEVRDRLDDRFQLLVGTRRGLERHQTLRHAVQWSYDLLDDAEQRLLNRCSVFAGGFDVSGAHAVAGAASELATLNVLDSLVRKSLVVADRASGRTRYAMLETIRQFGEEQLAQTHSGHEVRAAHARYFAGHEADVMSMWDSPLQREAYAWFTLELPNLRAAFRWALGSGDLDAAISIAIFGYLGDKVGHLESAAWAEELIEPAKAAGHRRLPQIYVTAAVCYAAGRIDTFGRYAQASEAATESGCFDPIPDYCEADIASGYITMGEPELCVELCRNLIARRPGPHHYAKGCLTIALTLGGAVEEAVATSRDFLTTADAESRIGNPGLACLLLFAYGYAHRDAHPDSAYQALEKGLLLARHSNNRSLEAGLLISLSRLSAAQEDPSQAFDFLAQGIRHYHDSGGFLLMMGAFAILATLLSRLGCLEPAVVIGHFADNQYTRLAYPEIVKAIDRLVDVLGADDYQKIARKAEGMSNAEMVTYALDQIERTRANLPGAARD